MATDFENFLLQRSRVSLKAMYLMHCTSAGQSVDVLRAQALRTSRCRVYGTDLLYLFYGRPAYKAPASALPSAISDLAPVCLILDPELLGASIRILPFDSGGFDRYSRLIGTGLSLEDFTLGPSSDFPMRLVGAFYDTNENYYEQKGHIRERDIPFSERAARAYSRVISDVSVRDDDDRCGTVEVQFDSGIKLSSALKAIVGPTALLDDPSIEATLAELGDVTLLPYKTYGRSRPSQFAYAVYEKAEDYQRAQGVFE